MSLENEVDASFYNLIHQLAETHQSDVAAERRDARRQPFVSTQRIAMGQGDEVPDESEFLEVRCNELTRGGFSFFLPAKPDFDSLVAAFGNPPEVIYVAAELSYCCDVLVYPSGLVQRMDGEAAEAGYEDHQGETATPMVLVGCRFSKRLYKQHLAGSTSNHPQ